MAEENMFKHESAAELPVLETDNDYHKYKSRRNAWVTVAPEDDSFTLPKDETTFDELYVRASGKPTANLNSVTIKTSGDYGLLREVNVAFTCFDRNTFLEAEKKCLRPNKKIKVAWGYSNPSYGVGCEEMDDLSVAGFNWTVNDKNYYVCNFKAIGPTAVLHRARPSIASSL